MSDALDQRQPSLSELATRLSVAMLPIERLRLLVLLERAVQAETRSTVDAARFERCTWSEIGSVLGVSKQAAAQRYGRRLASTKEQTDTLVPENAVEARACGARRKGWRLLTPGGRIILRLERDT